MKTLLFIRDLFLLVIMFLTFYTNRILKSFIPNIPLDNWKHWRGVNHEIGTDGFTEEEIKEWQKLLQKDFLLFLAVLIGIGVYTWFTWAWLLLPIAIIILAVIVAVVFVWRTKRNLKR